ncbi:lectin-domain containing receptor kinase VI.3-like [Pistacia vera]|uniref:lectin-domain containing receptor kinase VI.3-like n=1 Tax=Pistacia vera TaxID=55513 RepID=UPI00126312D5|nr:lectin-domain containing receptor kinase VI.3-like [Pistacia vera]
MAMGVAGFFCFFFFLLFPILAQSQTQPTSFIFQDFRQGETNLSLDRDASIIRPSGLLRLTKRSNNVIGHAFYVNPIQMFEKNSSSSAQNAYSFSTTFVFEIVSPSSGHGGYGLAFLLAPSKQLPGADYGHYLGIFNPTNDGNASNHVSFVEFDTVNGFKGESDDDGNHVGVGINSMNSRSKPAAYYHNPGDTDHQEEVNLEGNGPIQAWIEYDGEEKVLNVTICYAGNPKPVKPLINYRGINLTDHIKETMYVGFSASTGDRSSSHYISGWSFSLNGKPETLNVSAIPKAPKEKESTPYNRQTVAIISSLCAVTVLLLGILVFFLFYRRSSTSEILEDWEIDCPHRFRYKDLYEATKGFRENEVIGVGGFGAVYRGVLPTNGSEVAVKKITRNSLQGMREFAAEIESLGRLRHKNLVNLHGWCKQKNDLLLVYEYIPNGSLDTLLFKPKNGFVLKWEQRFNIVKGVAEGLLYLHEEWEQVVIHRDVKASNVLIDAEMNARLGDFGLARLYDHGGMSHTTNVVGTIGYIAPELSRTGKASASSDVYAYGILLLEVATGQRPIGSGTFLLMEWVNECQQLGRILDAVDPLLKSDYAVEEMELVLKLGLICSHQKQELRPTMRQVMRYLCGDELLPSNYDWSSIDSQQGYELSFGFLEVFSFDTFKASHASSSNVGFSSSSMENGR